MTALAEDLVQDDRQGGRPSFRMTKLFAINNLKWKY
jgi:hypothetical protein